MNVIKKNINQCIHQNLKIRIRSKHDRPKNRSDQPKSTKPKKIVRRLVWIHDRNWFEGLVSHNSEWKDI